MNLFPQFILTYFISTTALAGFAVLWRNWLEDHPYWKSWVREHFGSFVKALTCGSCFTLWLTLFFVLATNPLQPYLTATASLSELSQPVSYFMQWMSLGWTALFLRFSYIFVQEQVSIVVHQKIDHQK